MIGAVHEAIRSLLYSDGKIPSGDVDITFATPTRDWVAGISRPTINFNLYAIVENAQFRETDFIRGRQDMRESKRLRPRRIDLRYVVTTHFKSQLNELEEQEWQVLWRVLATLMRNAEWPQSLLPAEARQLDIPLQAVAAAADGAPRVSEVFNALGIAPRPALHYVITVPLDLNIEYLNTLVVGLGYGIRDMSQEGFLSQARRYGWNLVTPAGEPVVGAEVRLPDGPGFSISSDTGMATTQLPHDEVKQLLVRLRDSEEWLVVKVKKGEYTVVVK